MFARPQTQRQLFEPRVAPATALMALIDPLVTIGVLLACVALYGVRFDGAYLILVLVVFSLTFPGSAPGTIGGGALAREVLTSWGTTVGLLLFIGWATRTLESFDPRALLAWLVATPVARFATHAAVPRLMLRVLAANGAQRVAVVAGASDLGRTLVAQLRDHPLLGIRVAGFFDDRGPARTAHAVSGSAPLLGTLDQLAEYTQSHRVDLIYITLPMASQPRIMRLLDQLHDTTASIYFVPDIFVFDLIQARIETIGGIPVASVCETPFSGFNGFVKRASDIVLASVALLLVSPLLLAIAIAVKLSSPGPVLFRQRRYGLDGREIHVYKFRSMTVTEDGGHIQQATRDDRRVTRVGALLRRYSLDELPQFINVLQGRMSVVGPRPHAVAHSEMYRKLIKGYMIRHKVKPGITGWAQVNGFRGETRTLDRMESRIAYDLAYLRHWSLQLDLWIVLKTLLVVVNDRNAY